MAIVQCENMHYFDNSKNVQCPYCLKIQTGKTGEIKDIREQETIYKNADIIDEPGQATEVYGEAIGDADKTISLSFGDSGNRYTVGWLVCIKGPVKGKSYSLFQGRNFAGRSLDMDIVLSDDLMLSREKHFSIVYDPKSNSYYLLLGTGSTLLNGEPLTEEKEVFEGDIISVGASEYIFIPYCKEGRTWSC